MYFSNMGKKWKKSTKEGAADKLKIYEKFYKFNEEQT